MRDVIVSSLMQQAVANQSDQDFPGVSRLRRGDNLVWRLDRLGRSLFSFVHLIGELEKKGIGFRSITEQMDSTTSGGRLIFQGKCLLLRTDLGLF